MQNKKDIKFGTKAIHAGLAYDTATGAIMTPIYQTSTYAQSYIELIGVVLVPELFQNNEWNDSNFAMNPDGLTYIDGDCISILNLFSFG